MARYRTIFLWVSLILFAVCCLWLAATARAIAQQSTVDEAKPADVIIVLGAAEYRGRPSPVLEARLNHALFLYLKQMAPRILTTGGAGGDPDYTEGEVGRAYLSRRGVPSEAILVEPEGSSTAHSTAAGAEIMRRMDMHTCIVVSDGYHIYRVKKLLEASGFIVYGSPRPTEPKGTWREYWLYVKQAIAYGLWSFGIKV
ncbi:MAG: YdcF family protein [Bryobacteraceae bacterium]